MFLSTCLGVDKNYTCLIIRKITVCIQSRFVHIYMAARKGKTTIFAYTKCKRKN